MNKAILFGLGILLFIIGLIVAYLAGAGLITNVTVTNLFSRVYSYLIEAAIAIAFMVVGGISVFPKQQRIITNNLSNPYGFYLISGKLPRKLVMSIIEQVVNV
jgi:hypothetical protein